MKKLFKVLFFMTLLSSVFQAFGQEKDSPANKIARLINSHLNGFSSEQIANGIKRQYIQFNLMNNSGKWLAKELEEVSDQLIPQDLDEKQVKRFVDLMAHYAEKNDYLMDFLNKAKDENFPVLFNMIEKEGHILFPELVAFSLALQNLTKVMRNDWRLIEVCQKIWVENRKKDGYYKLFKNIPLLVKLESVEAGIDRFVKYHKSGVLPAAFSDHLLSANILEATAMDFAKGNFGNVDAGRILARQHPGEETKNKITEQGPTVWSSDKKAIWLYAPYPKQWADLYGVWNMAFVSQFDAFPFYIVKLIIPQVNDYENAPPEYIYNRAIALYALLNYTYIDAAKNMKWSDKKLTRLWGNTNSESAKKYEKMIIEAK
ncbi:MAG: hypothetical protein HQM10_09415 [Candidatus Riflebacteria bacterium]|nr:hypothetical protein [Candidatus Riflebacteria bacterium]